MKKILLTLTAMFVAISLASCAGTQSVEEVGEVDGDSAEAIVAELNSSLQNVAVSGFAYNNARVKVSAVAGISKAIKAVQPQVPNGYVLKIRGHNDQYEGRSAIGLRRAKAVMYELRGLDMSLTDGNGRKNVYPTSVYANELLEDEEPGAPEQRRVTFKIEKR